MIRHSLNLGMRHLTAFLLALIAALIPRSALAETTLEYVGPPLRHFVSHFDPPPPEITSVRMVIVLHDGVPTRSTSVNGHSRESHEGKVFKRAEITLGRNTYKFQLGRYMDGDLNVTFDAAGNVSNWQIRYFGGPNIALYGPGSVRPRNSPGQATVPPVEVCPSADVVASLYSAIGCGRGVWRIGPILSPPDANRPTATDMGEVRLLRATTKDARSISVIYSVSRAPVIPFTVTAYRSPVPDAAPESTVFDRAVLITSASCVEQRGCLDPGIHELIVAKGVPLRPDFRNKYIVVVSDSEGKKSSAYFRKFAVAAISHGYGRWYVSPECDLLPVPVISCWPRGAWWIGRHLQDDDVVPAWEPAMADAFEKRWLFDSVIPFDWRDTAATPEPDLAIQAGQRLGAQVHRTISFLRRPHPDDVVDLLFVGHSRGTVVVSEAIKYLSVAEENLLGGFLRMVLLDPHPANSSFETWFDAQAVEPLTDPPTLSFTGEFSSTLAKMFQDNARDPKVIIPELTHSATVWYQHTPARCLGSRPYQASTLNLWGMVGPKALTILNGSLTNVSDKTNCIGAIGHNEVPDLYLRHISVSDPWEPAP